jgi:5'-AMP-activated protein kinase catalytic alpha subunit
MIAGKKYNGLLTDIWSTGVVLYAMVCGYLPFEDPKTSNLYKKILSADYQMPKFVSSDGKDIIGKVLNTNPEERFTISQIRNHSWFKQVRLEEREKGLYPTIQKMPFSESLLDSIIVDY